jgi:hypothetical protein
VVGNPVAGERANPNPKHSALSPPAADVKPTRDRKRNTTGTAYLGNSISLLLAFGKEDRILEHILTFAVLVICSFEREVIQRGHF